MVNIKILLQLTKIRVISTQPLLPKMRSSSSKLGWIRHKANPMVRGTKQMVHSSLNPFGTGQCLANMSTMARIFK